MDLRTALFHFITSGYLVVQILVVSVCVFFLICFWVGSCLNWKHVLSGQKILNPMGKLWAKITIFP
jgi:hypothetical protein